MTITEFLLERIAEDEAVARDRPMDAYIHESGCYYYNYTLDANWHCDCDEDGKGSARILAECAAKRAIVAMAADECGYVTIGDWSSCSDGCPERIMNSVIRTLAAAYANHPDYDETWKP